MKPSFLSLSLVCLALNLSATHWAQANPTPHVGFGVGATYQYFNSPTSYLGWAGYRGSVGYPVISAWGYIGDGPVQLRGVLSLETFVGSVGSLSVFDFSAAMHVLGTLKLGPLYFGPGIGISNSFYYYVGNNTYYRLWLSTCVGLQFGKFFIDTRGMINPVTGTNAFSNLYFVGQVGYFFK